MRTLVLTCLLGCASEVPEPELVEGPIALREVVVNAPFVPLGGRPLLIEAEIEGWVGGPLDLVLLVDGEVLCERVMTSPRQTCTFDAPLDGGVFLLQAVVTDPQRRVFEASHTMLVRPRQRVDVQWTTTSLGVGVPPTLRQGTHIPLELTGDPTRLVIWSSVDDVLYDGPPEDWSPQRMSLGPHHLIATVTHGEYIDADELDVRVLPPNLPPAAPVLRGLPSSTGVRALAAPVERVPADPNGDPVSVYWTWSNDGVMLSGPILPAEEQMRGQRWELTVAAQDPYGASAAIEVEVEIVNSPPVVRAMSVEVVAGEWRCIAEVEDPDGAVVVSHRWVDDDGVEIGVGDHLAIGAQPARCEVVAEDDLGRRATGSVRVTPGNQPPLVRPTLATGLTTADPVDVQVTPRDLDGDPITLSYRWTVDGQPVDNDGASLPPGTARAGQQVVVTAYADDGTDVAWGRSDALTIDNHRPSPPRIVERTAARPGDLQCAIEIEGRDADDDELVHQFFWSIPVGSSVEWPGDVARSAGDGLHTCTAEVHDGMSTAQVSLDLSRPTDLDGDGHLAREHGGTDCDDDDPDVYEGAPVRANDCRQPDCAPLRLGSKTAWICPGAYTYEDAVEICATGVSRLMEIHDTEVLYGWYNTFFAATRPIWLAMEREDVWRWRTGLPVLWDRWMMDAGDGEHAVWTPDGWNTWTGEAVAICESRR